MSKFFKVVGAVLFSRDGKGALDWEQDLRSLEICHSGFDNDVEFLLEDVLTRAVVERDPFDLK